MRFVTVSQMKAADAAFAGRAGNGLPTLMARAGACVARAVLWLAKSRDARRVVCVAGHGNNGGDAFVAARLLSEQGLPVGVMLTASEATLKGDALAAFRWMRDSTVQVQTFESETALFDGIIVDGVLGTGCASAPRGSALEAIRWMNARRADGCAVVAVDLPSGMGGDTGFAPGEVVHADWTVTLCNPKPCFLNPSAAALAGHVAVGDIGMPAECLPAESSAPCEMIALPELRAEFPVRPRAAHKGDFGRVLILGGSAPYPNAPVLAALGALRGGAGLLTLAVPEASLSAASAWVPEAMRRVLPVGQDGSVSADALERTHTDINAFDAVVIGPGLTRQPSASALLSNVLSTYAGRLVIDADALAMLPSAGAANAPAGQARIITPHPGEAALLAGKTVGEIQADRLTAVRGLAERYASVAVLKGAGTLVCGPGGVPALNLTGNPGMATGGTGDVLAGLAAALWASGGSAFSAAKAAVWAHGTAGDLAALQEGETALSATSLAARLGKALRLLEY